MILAGHQPNYLPYLGFFDKLVRSDVFFILDDAQFSKGDFHNRNRIKARETIEWLTIPVIKKKIPINETKIKNEITYNEGSWQEHHLCLIEKAYSSSPFFSTYFPSLEKTYLAANNMQLLAENNVFFLEYFCNIFNVKIPKILTSTLHLETRRSQKIVDICKILKADTYLSGDGAKEYLDEKLFAANNIKLIYQNYKHPTYPQIDKIFTPYMGIIDYLFNCGAKLPQPA